VKRWLAICTALGIAAAAVAWRFFSSVRVQAFIGKHGGETMICVGVVIGVVVAIAVVTGVIRVRRVGGASALVAVVAFALAMVAYGPATVAQVVGTPHTAGGSPIVLGLGAVGSLIGLLWIHRIMSEIGEPHRSFFRIRRRTDDPGWRRTMLAEVAIAAVGVVVTVFAAVVRLRSGEVGAEAVWVSAPVVVALVAFAWMLDHGWAVWHREAQRPSER